MIVGIIIAVVVVLIVILCISIYNKLVQERNKIKNAWSQIDVQLKRRFDLIPNLCETIKGYAKHESSILEEFAKARTNYQKANEAGNVPALASADAQLTKAFNILVNAVQEQYPELKADAHFKEMMATLQDTENKIAYARQFYNDIVLKYNNMREVFPNIIVANLFGFKAAEFFKVEEEARENPKVSFQQETALFFCLRKCYDIANMVNFIKKLLQREFFRFLIAGGINTLMGGILIPLIFRKILTTTTWTMGAITIDLPLTIGYLIWFTFAYIIQAKFVFKAPFAWQRYIIYPFSQIPNYALNQFFIYIFGTTCALPYWLTYILAALCPIPIMFVIVRLIVKPLRNKKQEQPQKTEVPNAADSKQINDEHK